MSLYLDNDDTLAKNKEEEEEEEVEKTHGKWRELYAGRQAFFTYDSAFAKGIWPTGTNAYPSKGHQKN